jgi:hypothetical protein
MANFYNLLGFPLKLAPEALDWLRGTAAALSWICQEGEDVSGQVPDPLTLTDPEPRMLDLAPDQWETARQLFAEHSVDAGCWIEPDTEAGAEVLSVTTDVSAQVEVLSGLIQATLVRFGIEEPVGFEWAVTCSAPIWHEFSGGAVVITRRAVGFLDTGSWLTGALQRLQATGTALAT